ncbi:ABC transporter permease [Bacillus testis]|uniref:ABC transporter permease n=1 Tax=Bacillus testis TaxID=1622072 RepID=UPI00067F1495|nr:ABC transporter permease [Bacillus testis]
MLLKNVFKTITKKWMQLLAIGLIIILSSATYTMTYYALSGIEEPTEKYLKDYQQEDFSVEMLNVLTNNELQNAQYRSLIEQGIFTLSEIKRVDPQLFNELIEKRQEQFTAAFSDVAVELRESKKIQYKLDNQNHSALLLKDANRINLSYIEQGNKPEQPNEIAIDKTYAQKNDLRIGDTLTIQHKTYTISGFVLFPDYTLLVFDNSLNMDTAKQTVILMTDDAYETINEREQFRLAGIQLSTADVNTAFDEQQLPFVTQIIDTAGNMRSGAIYDELTQSKTTVVGLSIFITGIAVIMIAIMIFNILQNERGQIGILKALGYSRVKIVAPYLLLILTYAFFMMLLGYGVGVNLAEPLKNLYLDFYLVPEMPIHQLLSVFVTAILVPLTFFALVFGFILWKILRESALQLLTPQQSQSINRLSRLVSRLLARAKGSTKFKYLQAIRSTGSFIIFFLGIMFATILITLSFMLDGLVDRMTVGYLEKVDFQYIAYVDVSKAAPALQSGEEPFLTYPYAKVNNKIITLQGLQENNRFYQLYDADDRNITALLSKGVIITQPLSITEKLSVGDTIKITVNNQQIEKPIVGIVEDYTGNQIIMDIKELSLFLSNGQSDKLYSGIYSKKPISDEYYLSVSSKKHMLDLSASMSKYMLLMTNVLIGAAAIIAASILFVLTSFTVEKNYYAISLLKVMGYTKREVNAMILNSYYVYALICYAISIPVSLITIRAVVNLFANEYNLVLPLEYHWTFMVYTFVILSIVFLVSTWVSRRKINRIPLQEVLKQYNG